MAISPDDIQTLTDREFDALDVQWVFKGSPLWRVHGSRSSWTDF